MLAGGRYEMAMVKLQTDQTAAAQPELKRAIELWESADPDLDELRQAKQQLARLGVAQR